MNRSRLERETVISFNDVEDEATVWSASPKTLHKLEKMGFIMTHGTKDAKYFKVPKKSISFRSPKGKKKMSMTPEQKLAASLRMKDARNKKHTTENV